MAAEELLDIITNKINLEKYFKIMVLMQMNIWKILINMIIYMISKINIMLK